MSEPNFEGHDGRQCGEHRTLGRRAWCHDCGEYCYPSAPCMGCELPKLRAAVLDLWANIGAAEVPQLTWETINLCRRLHTEVDHAGDGNTA